MPFEELPITGVLGRWGNLTPTNSRYLEDDPSSPDSLWCNAVADNRDTSIPTCTFDTPAYPPNGKQFIRLRVRKSNDPFAPGPVIPHLDIRVYDGPTVIASITGLDVTAGPKGDGEEISFGFTHKALNNPTGADVAVTLIGRYVSNFGYYASVDFGAVRWTSEYTSGPSTFSVSGSSGGSFIGLSLATGEFHDAGVATAFGTASALVKTTGNASGVATVVGIAPIQRSTTGTIAGAATVVGLMRSIHTGAYADAGSSTSQSFGSSIAISQASSVGSAIVAAVSESIIVSTGSSGGDAVSVAVGYSQPATLGNASGVATVIGLMRSIHTGAAVAIGDAASLAVGESLAETVFSSDGDAVSVAISGAVVEAVATSVGDAVSMAVGYSEPAMVGNAAGVATVTGLSGATSPTTGVSAGVATVTGLSAIASYATASAAGVATVVGLASGSSISVGTAVGEAVVVGVSDSPNATVATGIVENHASMTAEFVANASEVSLNPSTVFGGIDVIYRMRARDLTLGEIVYWTSSVVDDAGAFYGGPGPLIKVVATRVLCEDM